MEKTLNAELAERAHAQGKRMTLQRRLVLDAVQRATHHTTAEEIATRIRARHPQIDPSTVYRNLEALEELGFVTHTHFNGLVTGWHRADAERHGHLVCNRCGSEDEIPADTFDPLSRRLRIDRGFEPDMAHSAIMGICRACSGVRSWNR